VRIVLTLIVVILMLGALVRTEYERSLARKDVSEGCLACHAEVDDPDALHPVKSFGCATCHLGNAFAFEKRRAHQGMVLNPGDLRVASQTCGREGCHPSHAERVKRSVMATNTGIIASLYRLWGGSRGEDQPLDVQSLMAWTGPKSPPLDYFSKLCGSCHLWRPLGEGGGEFAERGGGCSACHIIRRHEMTDPTRARFKHAELSMRAPMANCVRCHNRSARIGLTYQGRLEDDGYGTPHEDGGPNQRRITGGRHYQELIPDVHFRAGMVCIDCHTGTELMGDGISHKSLVGQLEIRCEDCHAPQFRPEAGIVNLSGASPPELPSKNAARLSALNGHMPSPATDRFVFSQKGSLLYALRLVDAPSSGPTPGKAALYRKLDGAPLSYAFDATPRPHHALPGHERLSCQACHSPIMPQCYGCHITMRQNETQYDKLLGRETSGKWSEERSYARFETPVLAVGPNNRIMPASPCQAEVSVFDQNAIFRPLESPVASLARAFDPHSTQKTSRSCRDCHLETKTMGLGVGRMSAQKKQPFRSAYDGNRSGFVQPGSPEALMDLSGRPLLDFVVGGPLEKASLARIRGVGPCLPCHNRYEDSIYRNFADSLDRLGSRRASSCFMSGARPVQCDTLFRDNLSHRSPRPVVSGERFRDMRISY